MSKNKLAIPRLTHFVAMLKENRYPNHPALVREMRMLDIAGAYSITQKTLQRDVAFLRGDYGAPIAYDYQRRGYYLTGDNSLYRRFLFHIQRKNLINEITKCDAASCVST